jgi:hypothetical protein
MHKYGLSMLVRAAHVDGEVVVAKAYVHRALARISADRTLAEHQRVALCDEVRVLLDDLEKDAAV